jgi:hypothetical protein
MRITTEHFNKLQAMIVNLPVWNKHTYAHALEVYARGHADGSIKAKDIYKRLRWDIFWMCPQQERTELMDEIYTYANDEHVDTCLKKICKTLK